MQVCVKTFFSTKALSHFFLCTQWFSGTIPLQHNRLVESPLRMNGKMPSIGLVRLCEHRTLVYGSITGYLVDWKVVPCLELLSYMHWKTLPGFLVVGLFGDVWSPLGIVQQFTARCNSVLPVEYQVRGRVWKNLVSFLVWNNLMCHWELPVTVVN